MRKKIVLGAFLALLFASCNVLETVGKTTGDINELTKTVTDFKPNKSKTKTKLNPEKADKRVSIVSTIQDVDSDFFEIKTLHCFQYGDTIMAYSEQKKKPVVFKGKNYLEELVAYKSGLISKASKKLSITDRWYVNDSLTEVIENPYEN